MDNPTPNNQPSSESSETSATPTSPLRCLLGAAMAGGLAFVFYSLTTLIARAFAARPISYPNPITVNIAVAVRTLVIGSSTLATGVFALVAVGLVALAIQTVAQGLRKQ